MSHRHHVLAPVVAALIGAGAQAGAQAPTGTQAQAYPGTIALTVDLSDTAHKIFSVRENIPVGAGPLTLLYPKWIPGEHAPSGSVDAVTGLSISADGQLLPWHRDLVDMFALHVEVPPGARSVDVTFQFLSPGPGRNFSGGVSATPVLALLEWNQTLFYPAGYPARAVTVRPQAIVPAGWSAASALEPDLTAPPAGSVPALRFAPVSLETLVDSPLATGRYLRTLELANDPVPVRLTVIGDRPEDLVLTDEQRRHHERLVKEATALFGARHYAHYDFLFVLSDNTAHFGLEHQQSSDDRSVADFFTDPESYLAESVLLPHEYVHSWNGKFRRPAGLLTDNFGAAMTSELLWVYEGLTNYYGEVLATRCGMRSADQFRDSLAVMAADMEYTPGRTWRPLQDTADTAQLLYNSAGDAWGNWRRGVDFYSEGSLIWLDVDTLIRQSSHGERSLDDFARLFFGRDDGRVTPQGYTMEDVVAALDRVQHYDWARFLRARLDARLPGAPLDGMVRGGWKLTYTEEASALFKAYERLHRNLNLAYSLGVQLDAGDAGGTVQDVVWNSPAFAAGLAPGMRVIAVNGGKFSPELLRDAIRASRIGQQGIELLVQDFDQFRTLHVEYHGGLRYPRLARIQGSDERLGAISHARN